MADRGFSGKDYVALGVSILLACLVWFVHNLSLSYSGLAQKPVIVECNLSGHFNQSEEPAVIAVRCKMKGYSFISNAAGGGDLGIVVAPEDMHHSRDDVYYMTSSDLTKYFHDIFGNDAVLEYFVTDTAFFTFPSIEYRKVPVRFLCKLNFRSQYMGNGDMRISPDSVLIYGDSQILDSYKYVVTEPVSFRDVCENILGDVNLNVPDDLRLSAKKIEYSLPVVRFVEQRADIPVRMVNVPDGVDVKVFPNVADLRVRTIFPSGDVDFSQISVAVDYDEFAASLTGRCSGAVKGLPSSVLYYDVNPPFFDGVIQSEE